MKKFQALLKDKDLSKSPDFKRIIRIYKACIKHFNKATELNKKAKDNYGSVKKKKSSTKGKLNAAKYAFKMAKNYKAMWRKLLKSSASHVERWVKLNEDSGKMNDGPKTHSEKPVEKKKKDDKQSTIKATKTKSTKAKVKKHDVEPAVKAKPEIKNKTKEVAPTPKPIEKPIAKPESKKPESKPAVKKAHVKKLVSTTKPTAKKAAPKPPAVKPVTVKKAPAVKSSTKDDLKKIEGIGPKIEGLLNTDGLNTFADVGKSSVARLQGVLDKAGPRYMLARPATWPQQARLAANGKWEELSKLQTELKGGQKK